ncbi:MAG: zinc ABC transporter substrate-binding protein [Planctomycetes bacterium]|nr:zinc ABC transporter substrate-binding protein [Planctomycetota bacterium]
MRIVLIFALLFAPPLNTKLGAQQKPAPLEEVKVVATTVLLGQLVQTIGGDAVNVDVLVKAGHDPHRVLPKASMLLRLKNADALIMMGLDYEHAFLPALLEKSRNKNLQDGGNGHENVGKRIDALEVPKSLDRSQGADLHPRGNPHYDLDPENVRIMALAVREMLQKVDPGRSAQYQLRWTEWDQVAKQEIAIWKAYLKPIAGRNLIAYHNSWPYFAAAFQFNIAGFVEPKPGLRPSPRHLAELEKTMQLAEVKVVLMESWVARSEVSGLVKRSGCKVILAPLLGASKQNRSYLTSMQALIEMVGVAHGLPTIQEFKRSAKEEQ